MFSDNQNISNPFCRLYVTGPGERCNVAQPLKSNYRIIGIEDSCNGN